MRHEKERGDAALRENGVLKACREELYKKTAEYEASNKDISEGVSRKLRPRNFRPQTSKTQTSKAQTSKTQTSKTQTSKTQTP